MSMNVGSGNEGGDPEVMVDMNTTPLIDVMLVLLIMLIITIPVQTHAVVLEMPAGNPPPPTPPVVVNIDVDFDGTLIWNGETVDRPGLDARLATAATEPVQPEIHLKPNKLVTYKYVAGVMASVQHHGLTKLAVVGSEEPAE
jgi:biopolymer transport protein ExbD